MSHLVMLAKDLMAFLFYCFLGAIFLWLTAHLIMAIYKTLFCDAQVKLYRLLRKRLNQQNNSILEKVLKKEK